MKLQKIKNFIILHLMPLVLGISLILIPILIFFEIHSKSKHKEKTEDVQIYNHYIIYDLELESKMWEVKTALIDEVQEFILTEAPLSQLSAIVVINECLRANVDLCFVLAQGLKESHFGMYGIASKTNSVWNVGAFDGKTSSDIHKDYRYPNPNESIRPYLNLLKSRYLVNKSELDLLNKYVDINGKRYASYEKYEEELKIIHDRILNTTDIYNKYYILKNYIKQINY